MLLPLRSDAPVLQDETEEAALAGAGEIAEERGEESAAAPTGKREEPMPF